MNNSRLSPWLLHYYRLRPTWETRLFRLSAYSVFYSGFLVRQKSSSMIHSNHWLKFCTGNYWKKMFCLQSSNKKSFQYRSKLASIPLRLTGGSWSGHLLMLQGKACRKSEQKQATYQNTPANRPNHYHIIREIPDSQVWCMPLSTSTVKR